MKTCYIIGGGAFDGFFDKIEEEDLVLAADKGYTLAQKQAIKVDYIIGDFDSSKKPEGVKVITLNPIKDFTDTVAAIEMAKDLGYKKIIIYGGLGGRESHTISNIRTLYRYKKQGIDIRLRSKKKEIFVLKEDFSYKYQGRDFYVSIFSLDDDTIISLEGLFYELDSYPMSIDDSLGVSNETAKADFKIKVHQGAVIVVFEDKSC